MSSLRVGHRTGYFLRHDSIIGRHGKHLALIRYSTLIVLPFGLEGTRFGNSTRRMPFL